MPEDEPIPTGKLDDESFLDAVFDQALTRFESGDLVDPAGLGADRPHLLGQVARIVELAAGVAVSEAADLALPNVPGYTVLSLLGRGGMGSVYLARQESMGGRTVALKVLHGPMGRAGERFRSEIRALARFRHPHIVAVHEVVRSSNALAYAMEFVEGPTLQGVIDAAREPEPRRAARREHAPFLCGHDEPAYSDLLCRCGIAVGRALQSMHEAGLVHRDVKPSNILLRTDGRPLLSDFGLVLAEDEPGLTISEQFLGTTVYAAPEQLAGHRRDVGPRSDVYALGATLYHALKGHAPFPRGSPVETLARITRDGAPHLALPRRLQDLETIVTKAMEPAPERRYASAADLADDLQRFLDRRPVLARRPTPLYITSRFIARHRAGVAIGIGAAAVAIAGVAGLALGLVKARAAEAQARRESAVRLENEYAACVRAAEAALLNLDPRAALRSLDNAPEPLRGWEWRLLRDRCDQSAAVWSIPDVHAVAAAAGQLFAAVGTRVLALGPPGAPPTLQSPDLPGPVTALIPSPDGESLLIHGGGDWAAVLDARTLQPRRQTSWPDAAVAAGAWKQGGLPVLAVTDPDGSTHLHQIPDQTEHADHPSPALPGGKPLGLTPFDLGRRLILVGETAGATLDLETGDLSDFGGAKGLRQTVAAPDGALVVAADDTGLWSFDPVIGIVRARLGYFRPEALAFLDDSSTLVGAVGDRLLAWDPRSGAVVATLLGHQAPVTSLAAIPGGRDVISASADGTIRRWSIPAPRPHGREDQPVAVPVPPGSRVGPDALAAWVEAPDPTCIHASTGPDTPALLSESLGAPVTAIAVSTLGRRIFAAAPPRVYVLAVPRPESRSQDLRVLQSLDSDGLSIARLELTEDDGTLQAFDPAGREAARWGGRATALPPSTRETPPATGIHLAVDGLDAHELFGFAIAGDDQWLAVTSMFDSAYRGDAIGSVSVYRRGTLGIPERLPSARLNPRQGRQNDHANDVAVGDGLILLSSSNATTPDRPRRGVIRVFRWDAQEWSEEPEIPAPANTSDNGGFASRLAYSGGVLVVTEPRALDLQGRPCGAVWVFTRQGHGWSEPVRLVHPGDRTTGAFGVCACVRVTADRATIVVGDCDDPGASGYKTGSAVVFERRGDQWTPTAEILPERGERDGRFGEAVLIQGDELLVGGPGLEGGTGRIEVFHLSDASWVRTSALLSPVDHAGSAFGASLAQSGGLLAAGARYTREGGVPRGQVVLFRRQERDWAPAGVIPAPAELSPASEFGCSIWTDGNILCAGAPFHDSPGPDSGAVWVFGVGTGPAMAPNRP